MKKTSRLLMTMLGLSTALFATDYSSWAKYRTVTLNTTGVTTTGVGKIPVLIRLTAAAQFDMFTGTFAALANGADVRVTKADGTTDVPFEVDSWTTGASGKGALWVLLDTVPANSATAYGLRIYWNKAGATTVSAPNTVFDTANGYLAVWHFNQSGAAALTDATRKGNNGTPTGSPTANANSVIGNGTTFDGSTQFYQVGTDGTALSLNSEVGPYTITAWAQPATCGARITVVSKYANDNSAGTRQFALQTANTSTDWRLTDNPTSFSTLTASNEFVADAPGGCVDGNWSYLAGRYSATGTTATADATGAANLSLMLDGGTPTTGITANQATGTSIGTSAPFFIGKIASSERYMNGTLDEITVSKVLRSDDFLKLSYATQKAAVTALTVASASVPPTALLPGVSALPGFGIRSTGSSVRFIFPAGMSGATVSILDVSGRKVWGRQAAAGATELNWNGGGTVSGLYLARIVLNGGIAAESKLMLP